MAVTCSFEREFLDVPQEALVATMETNQKFFPVLDDGGKLTEHFVGIANIESKDASEIRKGYERVIRPRFADAKFFFEEDLKQGLEAMGAGLATVTYQAKLGTVADKVQRVAALAEAIAPQVGVDAVLAKRAALLAKNDLQSRMVNEFPELQGIAGRYYAQRANEPAAVSYTHLDVYKRQASNPVAGLRYPAKPASSRWPATTPPPPPRCNRQPHLPANPDLQGRGGSAVESAQLPRPSVHLSLIHI